MLSAPTHSLFFYRFVIFGLLLSSVLFNTQAHSEDFLPPDQAFVLQSQSMSEEQAQLQWTIADDYYLYHQKFKVLEQGKAVKLTLPKGQPKQDPTFGLVDVHYQNVTASFKTKPNQQYQVTWQGCASSGLCYPPQRKTLHTDEFGLLIQEQKKSLSSFRSTPSAMPFAQNKSNPFSQNDAIKTGESKKVEEKSVVNQSASQPVSSPTEMTAQDKAKNEKSKAVTVSDNSSQSRHVPTNVSTQKQQELQSTSQPITSKANDVTKLAQSAHFGQALESDERTSQDQASEVVVSNAMSSSDAIQRQQPMQNQMQSQTQNQAKMSWNNDQSFLNLLNKQQMGLNLFLFLGFGILLAFLPCSLPLIPILSGVLIQQHKGYRAMMIALAFVLSMASVYAVMGILVSSLGYGFQRFFQQAWVLVLFSSLFVLFAVNLFGYFELSLPQKWLNRLNQLHHKQQGGQIGSAVMMGGLSALIVGPCMSAPLAGALIYVSQLQNYMLGAIYLFALGLGIGIPVFIVSVFGTRFIPKAGEWMSHLKVLFGFLMLAMAVYFIRPLLQIEWYQGLLALISFTTLFYVAYLIWKAEKQIAKISLTLLAVILCSFAVSQIQKAWFSQKNNQLIATEQRLIWQKVRTKAEFEQALQQAQQQAMSLQQPILLDVYADWCVACQPIEQQILPRQDVQAILQNTQRIKLDLTDYDESQDHILQQWQILGPPTMLFINGQGQEYRDLRLTGAFTAEDLKSRLSQSF